MTDVGRQKASSLGVHSEGQSMLQRPLWDQNEANLQLKAITDHLSSPALSCFPHSPFESAAPQKSLSLDLLLGNLTSDSSWQRYYDGLHGYPRPLGGVQRCSAFPATLRLAAWTS